MKTFTLFLGLLLHFSLAAQDSTKVAPKIYSVVERMPEFPGGEKALLDFVIKNVRYPNKAYRQRIQGKVIVRFVVSESGAVEDVIVLKSVRKDLDEEAVRVVSMLPDFKPAMQQGKPVKVYYNLPINFKLPG